MEQKINIAELLKDCPKGMELDCVMYENLYFDYISNGKIYPIWCYTEDNLKAKHPISFTWYGRPSQHDSAKCVIYPKGKNTWEGFVPPCKFKDGDVFHIKSGKYYLCIRNLFDKFGNIIFHKDDTYYSSEDGYLIPSNSNVPYKVEYCVDEYFRTHETKYLEKMVKDKFDITTLVPFESRVLARDYDNQIWIPAFWGKRLEDDSNCSYLTTNGCYKYCIPYEHNQHLLGTTNNCADYYKSWE